MSDGSCCAARQFVRERGANRGHEYENRAHKTSSEMKTDREGTDVVWS